MRVVWAYGTHYPQEKVQMLFFPRDKINFTLEEVVRTDGKEQHGYANLGSFKVTIEIIQNRVGPDIRQENAGYTASSKKKQIRPNPNPERKEYLADLT